MASLTAAIDTLREADVQAVAICFLHAWRNPAHEQQAAAIGPRPAAARLRDDLLRGAAADQGVRAIFDHCRQCRGRAGDPELPWPAAVAPARGRIRRRVAGDPVAWRRRLGGGGDPAGSGNRAVRPGRRRGGRCRAGRDGLAADIIGFDMGGTSTDIAVVRGGQPMLSGDKSVAGAKIALPSLDIVTLGAGGGSIGKLDRSGLLAVGPDSAGAVPGPACYGQGGSWGDGDGRQCGARVS